MKHGLIQNGKKPPEYRAWIGMKERCFSKKHVKYHLYGGAGIKVCDEWVNDFAAFFRYIGPKPGPDYSIDRIDGARGYEPGNVRWADYTTQNRNRRGVKLYEVDGEMLPRNQAAVRHGLSPEVVSERVRRGWPEADIFKPIDRRRKLHEEGV